MRLTPIILFLLLLAGCSSDTETEGSPAGVPPPPPAEPLELTAFTYEDSAALRPRGPWFTYHLRTLRAEGGEPELRQLINTTLAGLILQDSSGADFALPTALPVFLAGEFDDYRTQPVDEGLLQESAAPYSQQVDQSTEVLYQGDSLLVLTHSYYEYLGGAHGMGFTNLLPFALNPPRRLLLEDLVRPETHDRLSQLLTRAGNRSEAGLYVDTVPVTDNVAPLPGVLRFEYEPYAIGPYASGIITIDLPYDSLVGILRPEVEAMLPTDASTGSGEL